jgi:hypothetical protein
MLLRSSKHIQNCYTLKTLVVEIALVLKSSLCWVFCVVKRQTLYGKTGYQTQNNTNLCCYNTKFSKTGSILTQERFRTQEFCVCRKSDVTSSCLAAPLPLQKFSRILLDESHTQTHQIWSFKCNNYTKVRLRMGNWKIFSANFIVEQIWWHFCLVFWGPEAKLHAESFEIRSPKGTSNTNYDHNWGKESFIQQISFFWNLCLVI